MGWLSKQLVERDIELSGCERNLDPHRIEMEPAVQVAIDALHERHGHPWKDGDWRYDAECGCWVGPKIYVQPPMVNGRSEPRRVFRDDRGLAGVREIDLGALGSLVVKTGDGE